MKILNAISSNKLWNQLVPLLLIAIGALLIRIAYCIQNPMLSRDSIAYLIMVEQWKITGIYPIEKAISPFYLFLVKILSPGAASPEVAGRLVSLMASVLLIPVAAGIASTIGGSRPIVLGTAILLAVNPFLVAEISCQVQRDALALLLSSLTLWCIMLALQQLAMKTEVKSSADSGKSNGIIFMVYSGIAGIFSGLALLTRYESLGVGIIYLGFLGICIFRCWRCRYIVLASAFLFLLITFGIFLAGLWGMNIAVTDFLHTALLRLASFGFFGGK